jgi:hypothetical protein
MATARPSARATASILVGVEVVMGNSTERDGAPAPQEAHPQLATDGSSITNDIQARDRKKCGGAAGDARDGRDPFGQVPLSDELPGLPLARREAALHLPKQVNLFSSANSS